MQVEPFRTRFVYIEKSTFDVTKRCWEYSLMIAHYDPQFVPLYISHVLSARFERLPCASGQDSVESRFEPHMPILMKPCIDIDRDVANNA